jgi:hypothetical protein
MRTSSVGSYLLRFKMRTLPSALSISSLFDSPKWYRTRQSVSYG